MPPHFLFVQTKGQGGGAFFFAVCVIVIEIAGDEGWPVKGQSLHTA